jgi:uncharacterized membrane protein
MGKSRLEAFSDGVIAIIITIMVLELKVPHGPEMSLLLKLWPVFLSYVMSFVFVGIYWNNHHHLLHAATRVSAGVLWANLHLLFWLSLIPFTTGWMGENHFASLPTAMYGFNMLMAGMAYYILSRVIIATDGREDSTLGRAIGSDRKGVLSLVLYTFAIPLAFVRPWIAGCLFVTVSIMWLIPDRRIERVLSE